MRTIITLAMVTAVAMACGGCAVIPLGPTSATRPIDPGQYKELGPVQGKVLTVSLLIWPLTEKNPSRLAVDRAIAAAPSKADALIDITTDLKHINLVIINLTWTEVRGTAVKLLE